MAGRNRDREREPAGGDYRRPSLSTHSLDNLQSSEQQQLLNEIDKLRSYGISDFVDLPQLVVCGDQSAGKSSVLEAITEIPFPRKDALCTRFATELVLRRSSETKVLVKIVPGSDRSDSEREELARFSRTIKEFRDLPGLIEHAAGAMGITTGSSFSRDVLSIDISGPNRPQLTIVDLPGLIHIANRSQTPADVAIVSDLCNSYISNPRTIILAVVTAMNDIANQVILKRAKEVDPDYKRTLGIITKPDTLPPNSDSEASFVSLANNEDIHLNLGWHILRNRGFENRADTFADRNRAEDDFFSKGSWKVFPRNVVGVNSLRERLSTLLLDHIKHELPKVFKEIRAELQECDKKLSGLGEGRKTLDEQRIYLSKLSYSFHLRCTAAIDGTYRDRFFSEAITEEGKSKRLRALIQNHNMFFAQVMRKQGHLMQTTSDEPESFTSDFPRFSPFLQPRQPRLPRKISRSDALDWVKTTLVRCRGRELPGSFNPHLISELFWAQSEKWASLAYDHVDDIFETCQAFVRLLIRDLTTEDVFKSLFALHLDKEMDIRLASAKEELERLLYDRRGHAMTYSGDYLAEVQKARKERRQKSLTSSLLDMVGTADSTLPPKLDIDTKDFIDLISDQPSSEADADTESCLEALDCMVAYYRVALKMFVDNVTTQVIERRIVDKLWEIFPSTGILTMDAKTIAAIASESPEAYNQRTQLETKRERLFKAMTACRNALSGVRNNPADKGKAPETPRNKARNSGGRENLGSPEGSEEGYDYSDYGRSDIEGSYLTAEK